MSSDIPFPAAVTSSDRGSLRGRLIERPDQVEHHRWFSPSPGHDRGLHPFDGPTRAMLHQMRWRKSPPDHRRLWAALTIALFLHVLFVVVWYEMKPGAHYYRSQVAQAQADHSIQVRFITRSSSAAPVAPPAITPPPLPVPRPAREAVSKNAMTLHMPGQAPVPAATPQPQPAPATSTAPAPMLFDRTGRIILPANASSAPAAPDYVQHGPQGDTQIMQHRAGSQYQSAPNQFNQYFPPPKESFVHGLMRKLNGSESNTKSVDLPHGIHLKCQKVLGIPIPNCGIPPDPPPPTDGDERLNMAPASLVKGGPAPAKPDVATCIAIYKAGKPLSYGCPVDTPARAASVRKPGSPQGP